MSPRNGGEPIGGATTPLLITLVVGVALVAVLVLLLPRAPEPSTVPPAAPSEAAPALSPATATPPPSSSASAAPTTRRVSDASGLFSVEIPRTWKITASEGTKGIQLSRIIAQSPDFRLREDTTADGPFTPQYYEQGAQVSIHVTRGALAARGNLEAGTQRTERIAIDGRSSLLRVFTEPSTMLGQIIDAQVDYRNNSYVFTLRYNPDTFQGGEDIFKEILASFRFAQ